MEQTTDSSMNRSVPDNYWLLEKSLHGFKQAGHIWGKLLHEKLTKWGLHNLHKSTVEHRPYFLSKDQSYITPCLFVYSITLPHNDKYLIKTFKGMITSFFD